MSMSRLVLAPYDPDRDHEVHELFRDYAHKDYQLRFMGVSKANMVEYLKTALTRKDIQTICLRDEGHLAGMISLQSLPWMSEHFGLRMYAVSNLLARSDGPLVHARLLRYVVEELSEVDFLDCRVAVDDVYSAHALEVCGFRYVGTEVYMGRNFDKMPTPEPHSELDIGHCEPYERDQVLDIAGRTHVHNRFVYDPVIKRSAAKSLYRRLVANCFDHEDFNVLVARSGPKVHGFIVSKLNPAFSRVAGRHCGSLDFIGVRPESRMKGVGAALNHWALHEMAKEGAAYVAVRTLASNYAAMGTCYRTGFRVTSTTLHFHRWIHRPARSVSPLSGRSAADYSMAGGAPG
ncbi:GNAT family N-acetyltransferase [Thermodesulfobacteriota bacterium]